MTKFEAFLKKNRRYEVVKQNGLNVLVETESSKSKRAERREKINMFFTVVSAIAAVVAAVFSAFAYVNA